MAVNLRCKAFLFLKRTCLSTKAPLGKNETFSSKLQHNQCEKDEKGENCTYLEEVQERRFG